MKNFTPAHSGLVVKRLPLDSKRTVLLLDVGGRKDVPDFDYNANVYCVDEQDNLIWQIAAPPPRIDRDSFVSIKMEGQILRADRFFGSEYIVDLDTGIATEIGWHK